MDNFREKQGEIGNFIIIKEEIILGQVNVLTPRQRNIFYFEGGGGTAFCQFTNYK